MPSPDITPYLDLRIFDKSPQEIFDAAVLDLQTNLPAWVPREGNTEVLLLEALGLEVAESVFAINRLPSGIVEVLLRLFGITRDSGTPPVAALEFTMVDTAGYTIPAGTSARLSLPGGLPPIIFTTNTDLVIAPASSSGTVDATGDRYTDDANSTVAATALDLMDSIIAVDSVTFDSMTTNGRDPESSTTFFSRALTRFGRLSDTLVLPTDFSAYVLENADVYRAQAFDNWDGSGGTPGDDPGHITVAVYGNGATLSTGQKNALDAEMELICEANLSVHVIDPTITTQDVTAAVKVKSGYVIADVETACEAALADYLSPMTWLWSDTIRRFELVSLLDQVAGVDYVISITTPATDIALSGIATLVTAGTLAVTGS